ncbi:MAG: hypothetical protein HY660_05620 [Armatimonadetes bacterium]|nr:hypothetical protein [Armatimonadota bacterium]
MTARALAAVLTGVAMVLGGGIMPAGATHLPPFDITRIYPTEAAFQQAIRPYLDALAADARHPRAHYWLAIAYLHMHRLHRFRLIDYGSRGLPLAVEAAQKAVEIDPGFVGTWAALIDMYSLTDEEQKAFGASQKLVEVGRRIPVPLP